MKKYLEHIHTQCVLLVLLVTHGDFRDSHNSHSIRLFHCICCRMSLLLLLSSSSIQRWQIDETYENKIGADCWLVVYFFYCSISHRITAACNINNRNKPWAVETNETIIDWVLFIWTGMRHSGYLKEIKTEVMKTIQQ